MMRTVFLMLYIIIYAKSSRFLVQSVPRCLFIEMACDSLVFFLSCEVTDERKIHFIFVQIYTFFFP